MRPPGKETVTLLRDSPGGGDIYGDPVTSTTARIPVERCLISPTTSTEPTQRGRTGVVTGWTVHAPAGTDARFTDLVEIPRLTHLVNDVEVPGTICRIDGEVGDWQGHVVVINAVRAAG